MPYHTCENCGAKICYCRKDSPKCTCGGKKQGLNPPTIEKPVPVFGGGGIEVKKDARENKRNSLSGLRKGSFRTNPTGDGDGLENLPKMQGE